MSEAAKPKAGAKKGDKKKEAARAADKFSVTEYIEKTVNLDADEIKIDRDLTKGQVRRVSESNVKDLEEAYAVNVPDELVLTVSQDRGNLSLSPCSIVSCTSTLFPACITGLY